MKLTRPQERLLRALSREPFGISVDGNWLGTGRALVARGLAEEKQPRHFTTTEAGMDRAGRIA